MAQSFQVGDQTVSLLEAGELGTLIADAINQHAADRRLHDLYGPLLDRPAPDPNQAGRRYWAYDTGQVFRDAGASWPEVSVKPSPHRDSHKVGGGDALTGLELSQFSPSAKNPTDPTIPALRSLGDASFEAAAGNDPRLRTVRKNGVAAPNRRNLNLTGAVDVSDDPGTDSTVVNLTGGAGGSAVPTGTVLEYGGFNAPAGFVFADGAAHSRTGLPALFAELTKTTPGTTAASSNVVTGLGNLDRVAPGMPVEGPGIPVGTTVLAVDVALSQITLSVLAGAGAGAGTIRFLPHGQGDGSATFNVPDRRARAAVGAGSSPGAGLTARRIGEKFGAETHTLAVTEIPAHRHGQNHGGGTHTTLAGGGSGRGPNDSDSDTASAGGGGAHNNVQPSLAVTFLIKT